MRVNVSVIALLFLTLLLVGCHASQTREPVGQSHEKLPRVAGVWRLVELHDWNPDGEDVSVLGAHAPGLFVYTPDGHLSLHIVTEYPRDLIDRDTTDAELGRIFRPYIGYFGTYDVDYERMTITHRVEGAKVPNRIGRDAVRSFSFDDGDLILDFTRADGWRFYRRLQRVESF